MRPFHDFFGDAPIDIEWCISLTTNEQNTGLTQSILLILSQTHRILDRPFMKESCQMQLDLQVPEQNQQLFYRSIQASVSPHPRTILQE